MNILILSSMFNPKFVLDYELGRYLIDTGNKVLVTNVNTIDESMDSVYDVVLFRNLAPQSVLEFNEVKNTYFESIKTIPNVKKAYLEYDATLYESVAKALNIDVVSLETSGKCMAYGKEFEGRFVLDNPNQEFVCQKLYTKYYHSLVQSGKVLSTYSIDSVTLVEECDLEATVEVENIAKHLNSPVLTEIIYVIDNGFKLSFIDSTFVCFSSKDKFVAYEAICSMIEDKRKETM